MPLRTAELCLDAIRVCLDAAQIGNKDVMSDAGVGALMGLAGVQGAIYNVRINLPNIKDEAFIREMNQNLESMLNEAHETTKKVQEIVEATLKPA